MSRIVDRNDAARNAVARGSRASHTTYRTQTARVHALEPAARRRARPRRLGRAPGDVPSFARVTAMLTMRARDALVVPD